MRAHLALILALAALAACKSGDHDEPADTLLTNGTIHTAIDPTGAASSTTTAIAIRGGVIVALGEDAALLQGDGTEVVDLGGAHVYPGFTDAHVHLLAGSFALDRLLLLGTPSMQSMASSVQDYAQTVPADEPWIVGYGWLAENISDPTGAPIDAVVSDKPVLLVSNSGHEAIVNQKALELAGIDRNTPDPEGGVIARDENGDPTGYLVEAAVSLLSDQVLAAYDDERLSAALPGRLEEFSASGVTGVDEILAVPGFDIGRPWIYRDLEAAGQLPMRVHIYMPAFALADIDTIAAQRADFDGDLVQLAGAKVWVDGSMGSAEAWVSQPYGDADDHYGSHYFDAEGLIPIIGAAEDAGLPIKFHVNGDAAIDAALDALEAVADERGGLQNRYVFDHVVLTNDDQRARMHTLGIVVSVQPTHYVAAAFGETADLLGEERWDDCYDFRDLVDAGIPVANGTDWPVWPSQQPLLVSWNAATSQADRHGLTLPEALNAYTTGSATAIGRDDEIGRLDVGYLADFLVMGGDPLGVDIADVPDVPIQQVWVNGERVR